MDHEHPAPVVVPHTALSAELLRAVIESFVLREGTDYGAIERSLEEKVAGVMLKLARAEARILFDPLTDTVTIAAA